MKKGNKLTIITIILTITLIVLISIFGIYVKDEHTMKNILPEYKMGMEFNDTIVLEYTVDKTVEKEIYDSEGKLITPEEGVEYKEEDGYTIKENPVNVPEIINTDNFIKTKKIIENRLNKLGINQYNIRLDENTGKMSVEIMDTEENEKDLQYLVDRGTFAITDDETGQVLISKNQIKETSVVYNSALTETIVYVKVDFNEEGRTKLEEISKTYTKGITQEDGTITEDKKVNVIISNTNYFGEAFAFEEVMSTGTIYLPVGTSANSEQIKQYTETAEGLSLILGNDSIPILYNVTAEVVEPYMNTQDLAIYLYVALFIITVLIFILLIRYNVMGFLAVLLQAGFVSTLLLLIRFTNVVLTIEGIFGIIAIAMINYIITCRLLETYNTTNNDKNKIKEEFKKIIFTLIPLLIFAVVFILINVANLASFGMALLWGIILVCVYNILVTNSIFKLM